MNRSIAVALCVLLLGACGAIPQKHDAGAPATQVSATPAQAVAASEGDAPRAKKAKLSCDEPAH